MTLTEIVKFLNDIAWGPWMLLLLVGTGVYLSARVGFIQFHKFGYAMKNTIGKVFHKQEAGHGEVTPLPGGDHCSGSHCGNRQHCRCHRRHHRGRSGSRVLDVDFSPVRHGDQVC